jgi:outer membrane protein
MRRTQRLIVAAVVLASATVPAHARGQQPAANAPLTLSDAIAAAFAASSTTEAADAVRNAANLTARARNLPRTGVATIVRAEPEAGSPPRYVAAEQYTIELGSAVGRLGALQAAQAELAQATATLAATRRATASAVLGAFFAVGNDEAQAAAQAETVSLARRTVTAAVERHRTGIGPGLDMERARSALASAEADQAATAAALAGDEIGLATLVGRSSPSLAMPSLPSALPEVATVTDAAVRANPGVAAAQATLAASEAAVLLARAQVRPGVSIGAGIGLTRQAGVQNAGPAADISFTVPFGSGFTRANVAAAEAAVLVAKATLEQSRREAVRSALHAWTAARSALARLSGLQTASNAARHVAEADLAGYRLGAVSSADLVAAETRSATARAALEAATVQALQACAQLQFEMGALG